MDYVVIDTLEGMNKACTYFSNKKVLGFDLETTELKPWFGEIVLCQISDGKKTVLLDWRKLKQFKDRKDNFIVFECLKALLENENIQLVAHNSKFEQMWLMYHANIFPNNVFDTYTASVILDYNEENDPYKAHGLAPVAKRFLKINLDKTEQKSDWGRLELTDEQKEYAALDVYYLPSLAEVMQMHLDSNNLSKVAKIEFDVIPVIAKAEIRGHTVNRQIYEKEIVVLEELRKEASAHLQKELRPTTGINLVQPRFFDFEEKNYGDVLLTSHSQVLEALSKLGVPVFAKDDLINITKYERSGKPFAIGTGTKNLKPLIVDYPIVRILSDFRGIEKQVTSFGKPMLDFFLKDEFGDERIHAEFKIIGAPTGRMSCSKPNLQQIPNGKVSVGEKEYKLGFRKAFVAGKGCGLVNADYSQIELRIAAEFSQDPVFLEAFRTGKDLHALTASVIFDVPYEDCINEEHEYYKTYRSFSKRINFGIVYGIGAFGLAAQLLISQDEAQGYIDKHKDSHPVLWDYLNKQASKALKTLSARTVTNRVQWFREPEKDVRGFYDRQQASAIGRNGKNMPIQGCIGGDSRILIQDLGYVKISDAPKGTHRIWDGKDYVEGIVAESGLKQKVELNFKSGEVFTCSPEHKFQVVFKNERTWVKASELKRNQRIELGTLTPNFGYSEEAFKLGVISSLLRDSKEENVIYVKETDFELVDYVETFLSSHVETDIIYMSKTNYIKYTLPLELVESSREYFSGGKFTEKAWTSKSFLEGFLKTFFTEEVFFAQKVLAKTNYELAQDIQQALYLFRVRSKIAKGFNKSVNNTFISITDWDLYAFARNISCWKETSLSTLIPDRKFEIYKAQQFVPLTIEIQSVNITNEQVEMYDVVDSDTFKFMSNGIITHNTSADILKRALKLLDNELKGLDACVVNIVHDEITVEAEESILETVRQKLQKAMKDAGEEFIKTVPVKVDAKIISNWGEK